MPGRASLAIKVDNRFERVEMMRCLKMNCLISEKNTIRADNEYNKAYT
jgi:hypothetical protein